MTPPAPMTGSQKKAATFSGPMRSKAAASAATSSCGTELRRGVEDAEAGAVRLDAGEARPEPVGAVVAVDAADEVHALRLADGLPVAPGELRGGVDRVAAAGARGRSSRPPSGRESDEPAGELRRDLAS